VSEPLATTLGTLLAELERRASEAHWPAPEAGFAAHVFATTGTSIPTALAGLAHNLSAQAISETDEARWSQAPVLAAGGYVLAGGVAGNGIAGRWREGAARLAERDPFPPDRAAFFYRPVELLGLAFGAQAIGGEFAGWLGRVVADGERLVSDDLWHRVLGTAAAATLGTAWSTSISAAELEAATADELALVAWMTTSDADTATRLLGEHVARADLDRLLLDRAVVASVDVSDAARAAVTAGALRKSVEDVLQSAHAARWQLARTERDALELVIHLCQRFPRYVRQLAERHRARPPLSIDDEYDLQDHLHALLRLHFDDVREEEWTPSYGGSRARMDFLLKREQLVVEAKMTRDRLDQRKVVEELIIDKEHYRQHGDCETLVCFVYDPEHRLANPDALEGDLSDADGDPMTRVVVAPHAS
jgi:REase_DpnII-MboI